jgi:hypothetical protein
VRRLAVAISAVVALAAAAAGSSARAEVDAGVVLDRTYTCAVFFRGGVYLLDTHAHAGTKRGGAWARLPYAGVRSGVFGGAAGNLLAWITSGKPTKSTVVDQDYDTFDVATFGTVGVRRESCRQASGSVPLSASGLPGGAVPPLGSEFECYAPKQVVVRVRAVLASPGTLKQGEDFQTAHVPVREAKLTVRTLKGKPLVYADVQEGGKARLFTANGCTRQ